jgi:chemotaxis protein MotB
MMPSTSRTFFSSHSARTLVACVASLAIILSGCVTARQYDELRSDQTGLLVENEDLAKRNQALDLKDEEQSSQIDQLERRMGNLVMDTTSMGTSLRRLRSQYDKLNELNELLSQRSDRLRSEVSDENRTLLTELQDMRIALQLQEDSLFQLERDLRSREARVNELQSLVDAQSQASRLLKERLASALFAFRDKGLKVEERDGKVYVSLAAKLLFPSGSTTVDPEGVKALTDLAHAIESETEFEVVVEGHTDDVAFTSPVSPKNNWELSVLRATAVVEILTANSSIAPTLLSASGRSEFHPVNPEDRDSNRRIEVILAPKLDQLFDLLED